MIEAGKKYQFHCDSGIYLCVYTDALGTLFRNVENNHNYSASPDNLKLWTEYVEPKRGKVWVNIYPKTCPVAHESRFQADNSAGTSRLACVEVEWKEGQGLV